MKRILLIAFAILLISQPVYAAGVIWSGGFPMCSTTPTDADTWVYNNTTKLWCPTAPTGSGLGDITGPVASVDNELPLYSSTSGKVIKRSSATGIPLLTSGVVSIASAGTDYVEPTGNVATATALAANGANCSAGEIALGVNASGVAECTATPSGLTSVAATTFTGALVGNADTSTTSSATASDSSWTTHGNYPTGCTNQNVTAIGDTLTCSSITSAMFPQTGITDEYCLTYEGTGTTMEWQACGGGLGDTVAPATNTDNYVPQWNGADSKTLKNGVPISTTNTASAIVQRTADGDVVVRSVQLSTGAEPTCEAAIRGTLWYIAGGTGVKDIVEVCTKNAANVYGWSPIY